MTDMASPNRPQSHDAARRHGEAISCPPLTHYKSADECPDRAKHTSDPPGYLQWHAWAEKKAKTHDQFQCPTCGFWAIWKRKPKKVAA